MPSTLVSGEPSRVTVGMPVYNGEAVLALAIESILNQSFADLTLVISDNASTDATERICRDYAARDKRISYVRQAANIGADANFEFLLQHARSEYFMWAAADDTRSKDFLEENLNFLESHPDFVGSTSPVRFIDGACDPVRMGDETRDEAISGQRVLRFFDRWHANGRFYSLFRRADLAEARKGVGAYLASDWTVVIRLLTRGKMNRTQRGSVVLGRSGLSNSATIFAAYRSERMDWLLPLRQLQVATLAAVASEAWSIRFRIGIRLIKLSLIACVIQIVFEFRLRRDQALRA
jgi:glycosyltransferase involved in cell wall biosynthesis